MNSFSAVHWVILGVITYVVYRALKSIGSSFMPGVSLFCTACGHEGPTRTVAKGSIGIEIVLWLCLLVPGLIYSIWRHSTKAEACTACGATALVPTTSPVAAKMRRDLAAPPPAKP